MKRLKADSLHWVCRKLAHCLTVAERLHFYANSKIDGSFILCRTWIRAIKIDPGIVGVFRGGPSSIAVGLKVTMNSREYRPLQTAFLAGAVTDAVALFPMLVPSFAKTLWGFSDTSISYRFAMGYGGSLMFGWTLLLLWAARRPFERRFVAILTALVIAGLVVTEIGAVATAAFGVSRMIPTWCLQVVLIGWFLWAYRVSKGTGK